MFYIEKKYGSEYRRSYTVGKFVDRHGTQETTPNKRAVNMSQIFTPYVTG